MSKRTSICRRGLSALGLVSLLLSAGCATGDSWRDDVNGAAATIAALEAVVPPNYEVGDRFVFDDDLVEEVVAVSGERVVWRTGKTRTDIRFQTAALPRLGWERRSSHAEAVLTPDPNTLWPLETGKKVKFTQRIMKTDRKTGATSAYSRLWRCEVEDPVQVTVPAGTFDTFEIVCQRASSRGWPKVSRTQRWFYAPDLGHHVMFVEERRRHQPKVRRLVAHNRAGAAVARAVDRLDDLIQDALERQPSGKPLAWRDPAGLGSAEIVVNSTYRRADGVYCRTFKLAMQFGDGERVRDGRACRDPDGQWVGGAGPATTAAVEEKSSRWTGA